jgi:2-keto-3-deoxy-L-rhamnonate aldolase RhmA
MWGTCPQAKAVPGVRVAYTDERENSACPGLGRAGARGADHPLYEEAIQARNWGLFPRLWAGAVRAVDRAASADFWGTVPGGYRATINDNLVLILMIETLDGLKDADRIAKIPGVTAIFAASGDLSNH